MLNKLDVRSCYRSSHTKLIKKNELHYIFLLHCKHICLDCPFVSLMLVFQELEKKGDVKSDEEGEAEGGKKEDDEEGEEEEIEGEYEEVEEVKAFTDSRISG